MAPKTVIRPISLWVGVSCWNSETLILHWIMIKLILQPILDTVSRLIPVYLCHMQKFYHCHNSIQHMLSKTVLLSIQFLSFHNFSIIELSIKNPVPDKKFLCTEVYPYPDQNCLISLPYPRLNCLNTIPYT